MHVFSGLESDLQSAMIQRHIAFFLCFLRIDDLSQEFPDHRVFLVLFMADAIDGPVQRGVIIVLDLPQAAVLHDLAEPRPGADQGL